MNYTINYTLKSNNRKDIRNELVNLFLKEEPGNGSGEFSSRYKYIVETIDNYNIYLQRPAPLNKGFDFIVNIENLYFNFNDSRKHRNPSHNDIIDILTLYNQNYTNYYDTLKGIIYKIYNCENIDIVKLTNNFPKININNEEIPIGIILASIKWLFIEQDITYWNFSGRQMLFNALIDKNLL